jgi:hypothetical protein
MGLAGIILGTAVGEVVGVMIGKEVDDLVTSDEEEREPVSMETD